MIPLLARYRLWRAAWRAAWRMAKREHAVSQHEPPHPDVELVSGLQREAHEQHGPRPTAYTRKLGAVK